eukprot:scaffold71043_cov63-Phaeocystis_antarctica.AAC.2
MQIEASLQGAGLGLQGAGLGLQARGGYTGLSARDATAACDAAAERLLFSAAGPPLQPNPAAAPVARAHCRRGEAARPRRRGAARTGMVRRVKSGIAWPARPPVESRTDGTGRAYQCAAFCFLRPPGCRHQCARRRTRGGGGDGVARRSGAPPVRRVQGHHALRRAACLHSPL